MSVHSKDKEETVTWLLSRVFDNCADPSIVRLDGSDQWDGMIGLAGSLIVAHGTSVREELYGR